MWSRTFAGLVLGFFAAMALCGATAYLTPGGWQTAIIPAIALFPLVWLGLFAVVFASRTAARAWIGLGATTVVAWAALMLARAVW
ncbi:hypothetical protein [Pandoraea apista]|uniref:Transmembrane lipoprotein n=1 Tax=Pandoraea apista TaxID=93218 RepID=A0ABX9ZR24_9BURK|nr:hypothetical protein [Pandoraea apista]AJE99826.1 hypothetical protein SG18_19380 [Pandoraea apista]AKH73957.1 hypothetical protein XM39_19565 [Pandoraea apista]AKI62504.1 hypothetical protein AA956_12880 [Pandoraea apista]AVF40766.1 hypothetical protein AL486_14395 [Pandoraea apista]PTD99812.1 hypothetical protein C7830_17205 [Pandoraea apista]